MIEMQAASTMEDLAGALAGRLRSDPLGPFEEEVILVGDARGVADWLRLDLSQRLGVAASLRFRTPLQLVEDLARRLFPERKSFWMPEAQQEEEALVWEIFGALDDPSLARFSAPSRHVHHPSEVHRFRFAERLAKLFSSYAQNRPDLLVSWERGQEDTDASKHAGWQAALWRLLADTPAAMRLAGTYREVVEALQPDPIEAAEIRVSLPRRVAVFGAARMPETVHRVLEAASRHIDVLWYILQHDNTPGLAPGMDKTLARWGAVRRESARRIRRSLAGGEPPAWASPGQADPTLLGGLQAFLRGMPPDRSFSTAYEADRSVEVHRCHSPLRELEVLRDLLLEAFVEIPDLQPHEVLVALPDVAEYGPLIEAVFGQASEADPRIPFHIVHRGSDMERRLADSFIRLLELVRGRFEVDHVVDLLETPAVRRAAGLDAADVGVLRSLLAEMRIHWGKDGFHKSAFGMPATEVHTWVAGLDRLLMGQITGPVDAVVAGILPSVESTTERAELIGRFTKWFDGLVQAVASLDMTWTPAGWAEHLIGLARVFYLPGDADEERAFQRMLKGLEQLRGDTPLLPFDVVSAHLEGSLPVATRSDRFVTGRITFAEFHVLQGVSFRVTAAVGLDDSRMPRTVRTPGYDLVARDPQPGDPQPDALDRQAFLDLILSTRNRLFLLYPGRSEMDASERAPSVLLSQVLEVCRTQFGSDILKSLTIEHRLQPFSRAYFKDADRSRLFTYSSSLLGAARATRSERIAPFCVEPLSLDEPAAQAEVHLRDLAEAWVNPSRFFCRETVRLVFPREEPGLDASEPMGLDVLERYALKGRYVDDLLLHGRSEDEIWEIVRRSGSLPPGELGRAAFLSEAGAAARFATQLEGTVWLEPLPFKLRVGGHVLVGELDGLSTDEQLRFRPSKIKSKDQIRAWIRHLVLLVLSEQGEEVPRSTRVVGTDRTVVFGSIDKPVEQLALLLDELDGMRRSPRPLFEYASSTFVETRDKTNVSSEVRKAFFGNEWTKAADSHDEYVGLCFRSLIAEGLSPLDDPETSEPFIHLASLLWEPLIAATQKLT